MAMTKKTVKRAKRKPRAKKVAPTRAEALIARKKLELALQQVNKCISDLINDYYYGL